MSKLYRSREGTATAVDTKSQLSTLGSESAPGPLLVPSGAKTLSAVIMTVAPNFAAAARGGYLIRLEGPGLPEGPEVLSAGASGVAVATGGHGSFIATRVELNVPVTPSNEILIFGENVSADVGEVTMGCTLEFAM